jgi:hypothetical protein
LQAKNYTVKTFSDPWSPQDLRCRLPNCLDILPLTELAAVKQCKAMTTALVRRTVVEPTCHFVRGLLRAAVALNSQEGSGNSWLRGLLERATGICTGFYSCDPEMRARGFLGEGVKTGNVLVVKTHVHIPQWIGGRRRVDYEGWYGSAVYLIRNPARGVIAEWNRLCSQRYLTVGKSHTNVVPEKEFATPEWVTFMGEYLSRWKERTINWVLNNNNHPVHVVSYEALKSDTVGEVEKILDFLHYPYSHGDLVERLKEDFTTFRRSHSQDEFQHFSPEQKELLRTTILELKTMAEIFGKADQFIFSEYLEALPDIN